MASLITEFVLTQVSVIPLAVNVATGRVEPDLLGFRGQRSRHDARDNDGCFIHTSSQLDVIHNAKGSESQGNGLTWG